MRDLECLPPVRSVPPPPSLGVIVEDDAYIDGKYAFAVTSSDDNGVVSVVWAGIGAKGSCGAFSEHSAILDASARQHVNAIVERIRAAVHLVEEPRQILSCDFVHDGKEVLGRGVFERP